ncbi:hypothetical protein FI667_g16631, partial [Globisporangium splendens]
MANDPYDFEIAIPSGGDNTARSKSVGHGQNSRRYGGGSSDEGSSDGGSLSASDDDGGDDSIESFEAKTESKRRSAADVKSSASATKTPAPSASGSSVLDKAKNFLSKYSTKTVESSKAKQPTSSARSRRQIELSMDDSMDFSPDEDEESEESPKRSKQQPKGSASTTMVRCSDSSDDSDDQDARKTGSVAAINTKTTKPAAKAPSSESDDDRDESHDRGGYGATPTTMAPTGHNRNGNAGGNSSAGSDVGDDDAIASFMDESDDHDPPPFSDAPSRQAPSIVAAPRSTTASAPNPPISQLSKPKCDEVDSNGEESIASKSDYVGSFEDEEDVAASSTTPKTRQITVAAAKQSNASESGVYAEEGFDEESETTPPIAVATAPANNTSQPTTQDAVTKAEPNFDCSMDFSEDNVVGEAREKGSPSASSSSSSNSGASQEDEQSDFLENSDESSEVAAADEPLRTMNSNNAGPGPAKMMTLNTEEQHLHHADKLPAPASTPASLDEYSPFSSVAAAQDDDEVKPLDAISIQPSAPLLPVASLPNASIPSTVITKKASPETTAGPSAVSRPLSQVTIVREYEQPARGMVEMVDASTQITGNHAGIQADLIPDGMHNLFARPTPQSSSELLPEPPPIQPRSQSSVPEMSSQTSNANSNIAAPPASMLPTPGYSMDARRIQTAATTSIYKQQLVALQEQILLKKRETERLVQERMRFQYSTFRGTERALMRVDPTLSEQKAREIARLTTKNAVT